MHRAGTQSWSISIDEWDQHLEWALWVRAAEGIEVSSGGVVTGPSLVDPRPVPSLASGAPLAEGWLWWWRTLLAGPPLQGRSSPEQMAALAGFGPPDFGALADHHALQRVIAARWSEANAWHSARKQAGITAFRESIGPSRGREGEIVRAVERELGHEAAPFRLRIIVLPVADDQIRPAADHVFLVPEGVRASGAYDDWLRQLVRTLA